MSKGGGGGGSTTTVQKADPWSGLQPALSSLYGAANNWYKSGGPQQYTGPQIAGTNGAIQDSLAKGTNLAEQGPSPFMQGAQSTLLGTAQGYGMGQNPSNPYYANETNGAYLNANPYIDAQVQAAQRPVVQNFQDAIAPALASQFSANGRTGSGAQAAAFGQATDSLGKNLGDISTNMYGQNYANERQLQQQGAGQLSNNNQFDRSLQQTAAMAAPQFENMKYNDLDKLMGIGQYEQGNEQQYLDLSKNMFNQAQNQPLLNLQNLNQLLQGGSAYNSQSSQGTQQTNRNPFAGAVGGAAVGNALGGALGATGPVGALGGLLLGGLFG